MIYPCTPRRHFALIQKKKGTDFHPSLSSATSNQRLTTSTTAMKPAAAEASDVRIHSADIAMDSSVSAETRRHLPLPPGWDRSFANETPARTPMPYASCGKAYKSPEIPPPMDRYVLETGNLTNGPARAIAWNFKRRIATGHWLHHSRRRFSFRP